MAPQPVRLVLQGRLATADPADLVTLVVVLLCPITCWAGTSRDLWPRCKQDIRSFGNVLSPMHIDLAGLLCGVSCIALGARGAVTYPNRKTAHATERKPPCAWVPATS